MISSQQKMNILPFFLGGGNEPTGYYAQHLTEAQDKLELGSKDGTQFQESGIHR